MTHTATVGPMHKISLSLRATPEESSNAQATAAKTFEFVFGIGTEGMSAFEQALEGKSEGEKLSVSVGYHNMHTYFEHLLCPLMEAIEINPPFDLDIEIRSVTAVSDRELVKALAQKSGGCDGDCGCGCSC